MNLRTLKKLSKRAAPLLALLGDRREQFPAGRDDNYVSVLITARKHWARSRCHASYVPRNDYSSTRGAPLKWQTRAGRWRVLRPPCQPRKGTVMVGGMVGGEEPEWSEETAYEALVNIVRWSFVEVDGASLEVTQSRRFSCTGDFFAGAADLIAAPGK